MADSQFPRETMERRDFLRRIAAAGLILAGSGAGAALLHNRGSSATENGDGGVRLSDYRVALPAGAPRMAIARAERTDARNVEAMLRAALGKMGGIDRFVVKGDVVVVKPNVGFDRSPRFGATTSPEVVGAVVSLCREAGAARVIVTDNPINNPEGSFLKSGVAQAVREAGGEVLLPEPRHFRRARIGGAALAEWEFFHEPFRTATKVIGVPTAKDHNLSGASLAMKNWYGLLGSGRNRFHQRIDEVIADLGAMMRPTLVILDATRLLLRNGPTGGSPDDVRPGHTIAVAVDQVALDAFGFELLGKDAMRARCLELAEGRGLGSRNWRGLQPPEVRIG